MLLAKRFGTLPSAITARMTRPPLRSCSEHSGRSSPEARAMHWSYTGCFGVLRASLGRGGCRSAPRKRGGFGSSTSRRGGESAPVQQLHRELLWRHVPRLETILVGLNAETGAALEERGNQIVQHDFARFGLCMV